MFWFFFCQNGISVMLDRSYETFSRPTCKRFEERMLFNCAYYYYFFYIYAKHLHFAQLLKYADLALLFP